MPRSAHRLVVAALAAMAVAVLSTAACGTTATHRSAPAPAPTLPEHDVPYGAFLGSDDAGVQHIAQFGAWAGREATVGHTYLPGTAWSDIDESSELLAPWTAWRAAEPPRMLVLNVPLLEPNEPPQPDAQVRALLKQGVAGAFDTRFAALGRELVAGGAPDTVLVLGWEMNSVNYTSRCFPDPKAWIAYWRHIVGVLRAVPGQHFRFDYTPDRGPDLIPWTTCYPGDDVVDILGMDSYDQDPGRTFQEYVEQPYGLQAQADFAAARGKPISFAEWGLLAYGDDPSYVTSMLHWISTHATVYETIADYCPAGVWQCASNPASSAAYRAALRRPPGPASSSAP